MKNVNPMFNDNSNASLKPTNIANPKITTTKITKPIVHKPKIVPATAPLVEKDRRNAVNPMFNDNKPPKIKEKVTNSPKKTRSDKKHDIKIPLTEDDRKKIKIQAFEHHMTVTAYTSLLLKEGLKKASLFNEIEYNPQGRCVHAKVNRFNYEKVFHCALDWDYASNRMAAHRIVVGMLNNGGLKKT